MTYPFVPARWFSAGAITEVRALVVHFAEGGGTVNYFKDPRHADGSTEDVSAHFVLQRDGTIVQMVRDGDADHCQHTDGGTWAYPGGLTRSVGVAVLGSEVMDNPDRTRVNRYVHAIELEGFRDDGPTPAQVTALIAWVAERRAKFPTIRGVIGHGDIQNKACPGHLIPWDRLGGHGKGDMGLHITYAPTGPVTGSLVIPPKTKALRVADGAEYTTTNTIPTERSATTALIVGGSGGYLVELHDDELHFIYNGWLPDDPFTEAVRKADPVEIANAKAAGRESFRRDVDALP